MRPDVSIIIVNYNTGSLLADCLESISSSLSADYEVIVADNASSDGSAERCRHFREDSRFRLLELGSNMGFSKANNVAAAAASGRMFHFLNPDTRLTPGMDGDYRTALADPGAVYVNPLVNRDGSTENGRMPLPLLRDILLWNIGSSRARYWYKGASVIVSPENFRLAGGWCEDYFLYAEDLDLFCRIWRLGIPVRELPTPIYHFGGGSSSSVWSSLDREVMVQKSNRLFFRRNFSRTQYLLSKLYFLFHNLFRHPSRVPLYVRAWILSGKRGG